MQSGLFKKGEGQHKTTYRSVSSTRAAGYRQQSLLELCNIGYALIRADKFLAAQKQFAEILAVKNPKIIAQHKRLFADAYCGMGHIYLINHRFKDAFISYKSANELLPENPFYLNCLANAQLQLGHEAVLAASRQKEIYTAAAKKFQLAKQYNKKDDSDAKFASWLKKHGIEYLTFGQGIDFCHTKLKPAPSPRRTMNRRLIATPRFEAKRVKISDQREKKETPATSTDSFSDSSSLARYALPGMMNTEERSLTPIEEVVWIDGDPEGNLSDSTLVTPRSEPQSDARSSILQSQIAGVPREDTKLSASITVPAPKQAQDSELGTLLQRLRAAEQKIAATEKELKESKALAENQARKLDLIQRQLSAQTKPSLSHPIAQQEHDEAEQKDKQVIDSSAPQMSVQIASLGHEIKQVSVELAALRVESAETTKQVTAIAAERKAEKSEKERIAALRFAYKMVESYINYDVDDRNQFLLKQAHRLIRAKLHALAQTCLDIYSGTGMHLEQKSFTLLGGGPVNILSLGIAPLLLSLISKGLNLRQEHYMKQTVEKNENDNFKKWADLEATEFVLQYQDSIREMTLKGVEQFADAAIAGYLDSAYLRTHGFPKGTATLAFCVAYDTQKHGSFLQKIGCSWFKGTQHIKIATKRNLKWTAHGIFTETVNIVAENRLSRIPPAACEFAENRHAPFNWRKDKYLGRRVTREGLNRFQLLEPKQTEFIKYPWDTVHKFLRLPDHRAVVAAQSAIAAKTDEQEQKRDRPSLAAPVDAESIEHHEPKLGTRERVDYKRVRRNVNKRSLFLPERTIPVANPVFINTQPKDAMSSSSGSSSARPDATQAQTLTPMLPTNKNPMPSVVRLSNGGEVKKSVAVDLTARRQFHQREKSWANPATVIDVGSDAMPTSRTLVSQLSVIADSDIELQLGDDIEPPISAWTLRN